MVVCGSVGRGGSSLLFWGVGRGRVRCVGEVRQCGEVCWGAVGR